MEKEGQVVRVSQRSKEADVDFTSGGHQSGLTWFCLRGSTVLCCVTGSQRRVVSWRREWWPGGTQDSGNGTDNLA
jgi:hypothetical protein